MRDSNKITDVSRDDMAFFNSVLSYGIYTDREWMLGLNEFGESSQAKSFDDIVTEAAFELYKSDAQPKEIIKRNYELYISAYIKNNFEKFSLQQDTTIDFCSEKYGYKTQCQFQESDYFALNNLARAGYFLSKNEDGTQNLHLVFRGTDNKARDFMEFVGKAYLDMSAYYDAFKPLEEKILEFAKNPDNKIKAVHVSGHSLGGAMVQEFFNSTEVQNSGLNLVGFTYGAPGTDKKPLHSVATETFHAFKKVLQVGKFSAFKNLAICTLSDTFNKVLPRTLMYGNVLSIGTMGFNFTEIIPGEVNMDKRNIDKRIFQYEHTGDLIPKIGAAAYNEVGEEIYLKDVASRNAKETFMLTGRKEEKQKHKFFSFMSNTFNLLIKKPIRFVKNMFHFEYHDMMRYVVNLEHKISTEHNKENSPYYSQFLEYKERFTKNTTSKYDDLVYQRLLEKKNIAQNDTEQKRIYIRVPKEIEDKMNKLHYIQTTKNVVSDILGKPINYDIQKFTLSGTDKPVDTSIPQMPVDIADITKQFTSKEPEQPYSITFKTSAENIYTLRRKFLNISKNKNNNLSI